jgi:FixJ family two-component response regulator
MADPTAVAGAVCIFVIDDDGGLRGGLARLCRSAGWSVETYADAREFLARPPYGGIGCVLLDVRMPGMSGPQLQQWMAAQGVSLPVVFLTGHREVTDGIAAMKRGAVDYLLKPVDDAVLLDAIHVAIRRHADEHTSRARRRQVEALLAGLSRREREVLEHVVSGQLNKQIADDLDISLKTVKAHRARVMEKMKVGSLAELVHLCDTVGMPMAEPRN